MHIVRSGIVAAGLVTSTVIGTIPAHAVTAATFTGEATIASFGTGDSTGTARLCVNGIVHNQTAVACTPTNGSNATATFSLTQNPSECPLTGTASGSVTVQTTTGTVSGYFTWTRVGTHAFISVTWQGNGETAHGTAEFGVTDPVGIQCGWKNVKATIAGSIAGA